MISVPFQGKPFNITVIQAYAPASNTEEAEVEWFYEDLQDLLVLTPKICPSQHQGLSNELALCNRYSNYWSFSYRFSPSHEYSRLFSFRVDWFDLLVAKGTLKSLVKDHSSKASIPQCSAFFMNQLTHPYMTSRRTIALTRRNFVSKVISLVFNTLSRFFIAFLPGSKCLLISWLQSPTTVIVEFKKIKSHCFQSFSI